MEEKKQIGMLNLNCNANTLTTMKPVNNCRERERKCRRRTRHLRGYRRRKEEKNACDTSMKVHLATQLKKPLERHDGRLDKRALARQKPRDEIVN
jgi:hypothetical protein